MNDTIMGAIVGGGLTLISALVAYYFSERATQKREENRKKEQADAVRTLLALEIDHNLKSLKDFRERLNTDLVPTDSPNPRLDGARRLATWPLPIWSHRAWENQLSYLPLALNSEQIEEIQYLHNQFDTIAAIRSNLIDLQAEQFEEDKESARRHLGSWPKRFDENAPDLWDQSYQTIENLLKKGNPLQARLQNGN